jgi:hypothetical protein
VVSAIPPYMSLVLPLSHVVLSVVGLGGPTVEDHIFFPVATPDRQSLWESTARGGGLPV